MPSVLGRVKNWLFCDFNIWRFLLSTIYYFCVVSLFFFNLGSCVLTVVVRKIEEHRLQAPNVTMNAMGGAMAGPAPPYPRAPGPNAGPQMNPQQGQQFQVNQQRMRQQLIAMQQVQGNNPTNQPLGNPNQQPTPALMAQLQRQTQMPVQNPYSHQPPPY